MLRGSRLGLAYFVLFATSAIMSGPLVLLTLSSFKSEAELRANPHSGLPIEWRLQNYSDALAAMPFWNLLGNTLRVCMGCVVGTIFSCTLAAYAFARLKWPLRDTLFFILVATMMLPPHITMIPKFLLIRELGLYNSLAALVAPTFLGDAFSIFLLRQFFLTLPEETSEAGRLDGLGEWGIFFRLILPLSVPALVTVSLFQFIAAWNDFQSPLLYLSDPQNFTIAYGLERFVSTHSDQTHLLLAATVMVTLPLIALFVVAQKTFLKGIATTGLKQ